MSATPLDGPSQEISKPYHSKRPHKKTRTGCVNCKKRRVKCNEGRPSCSACLNRRQMCQYPQVMPLRTGQQAKPLTQLQRLYKPSQFQNLLEGQKIEKFRTIKAFEEKWDSIVKQGQLLQLSNQPAPYPHVHTPEHNELILQRRTKALCEILDKYITIKKLQPQGRQYQLHPDYAPLVSEATKAHLLHHFKNHTSASFNVDPRDRRLSDLVLSTNTFSLMSESTSCLMNCVLAMSSLHIKRLKMARDPKEIEWMSLQYMYTSQAQFNADMHIADEDTLPQLLLSSLLMTAISSEEFRRPDGQNLFIVVWIKVWRGIGIIMERIKIKGLINTGLTQLFYRPPLNLVAAKMHVPYALATMAECYPDDDSDVQYRDIYMTAARYLGTLYHTLKDGLSPMMRLRIITWFTYLPSPFVTLVMDRHWRALVIVAHYAVFLKLTTRVWWMEQVGQRSIKDLVAYLTPGCSPMMQVPIAAMETEDVTQIGRLLLGNDTWEPEPRVFDEEELLHNNVRLKVRVDDAGRPLIDRVKGFVLDENMPEGIAPEIWNTDKET